MKPSLLFIALFLTGTLSLSAQTKTGKATPSKSGTAVKTPKPAAPKDTSLCSKNWSQSLRRSKPVIISE
jgi:hypothetical protein